MDEQKRQDIIGLADKAERTGNHHLAGALRRAAEDFSPERVAERQAESEKLHAQLDEVQQRFDAALAKPL